MAKNTMFRGIELKIEEKTDPGDKPETVFSLKNVSGDSWSLAKIVGIGDGSFGGRLAFETNAGGEKPTHDTVERLSIDSAGNVGIGTTTPESPLHVFTEGAAGAHLMFGGRKITLKGVNDPEKWQARLPHIEWREGDNTRAMYIGYGDTENKHISMHLENKYKLIINGGLVEIEQEKWKEVTSFANGWKRYNDEYNNAGYFKDSMGIVHLRGLVKGGTIARDKPIFTLPEGYRPNLRELHVVCTGTSNKSGRVDIEPNGQVSAVAGDSSWISLYGITFRAAS
jgi:hypothetical protein